MPKFKVGDEISPVNNERVRHRITAVGDQLYLYRNFFYKEEDRLGYESPAEISGMDKYWKIYTPPPEPTVVECYLYVWAGENHHYIGPSVRDRDSNFEKGASCHAGIKLTFTNKNDGSIPEVKATVVYTKP